MCQWVSPTHLWGSQLTLAPQSPQKQDTLSSCSGNIASSWLLHPTWLSSPLSVFDYSREFRTSNLCAPLTFSYPHFMVSMKISCCHGAQGSDVPGSALLALPARPSSPRPKLQLVLGEATLLSLALLEACAPSWSKAQTSRGFHVRPA